MTTNSSERPEKIRSFIAVPIPGEVKAELGKFQSRLQKTGADVKWVRPESMHITLRFLGGLTPAEIKLAGEAVLAVAQKFAPFTIEVKGFGTFPERKRPRVIWAGLTQGAEELTGIFQSLEEELLLRDLGEADRPFAGHLTIGRVKTGKKLNNLLEYLTKEGDQNFGIYEAKTICLFQSRLHPSGAVYTMLREGVLAGKTRGVE